MEGHEKAIDDKVQYHASNAYVHLCELRDLKIKSLSTTSQQIIEGAITVTDRLSTDGELCQEKQV